MNKKIQRIFSEVPETYELINHILTFGFDILWRKRVARYAASLGGELCIDVCSGTGEMALYCKKYSTNSTKIYATDFSSAMVKKALAKKETRDIKFFLSDIQYLPIGSNCFDIITISFATRNINLNRMELVNSYREFCRILKPGGVFINLETSQPSSKLLRYFFHLYVRLFVKPIGTTISGSRKGYSYLSHTIPRFYSSAELSDILRSAGFSNINAQKLLYGVAAIHAAKK